MPKPQPIMDEVQGAALVAVLQQDIAERIEEVLPALVSRIEETQGYVPQSASVAVKYKPGNEDKPSVFEITAKLGATTCSTVRTTKAKATGPDGSGPIQLSMFVRD